MGVQLPDTVAGRSKEELKDYFCTHAICINLALSWADMDKIKVALWALQEVGTRKKAVRRPPRDYLLHPEPAPLISNNWHQDH